MGGRAFLTCDLWYFFAGFWGQGHWASQERMNRAEAGHWKRTKGVELSRQNAKIIGRALSTSFKRQWQRQRRSVDVLSALDCRCRCRCRRRWKKLPAKAFLHASQKARGQTSDATLSRGLESTSMVFAQDFPGNRCIFQWAGYTSKQPPRRFYRCFFPLLQNNLTGQFADVTYLTTLKIASINRPNISDNFHGDFPVVCSSCWLIYWPEDFLRKLFRWSEIRLRLMNATNVSGFDR